MNVERLDELRELIGEYWCLAFAEGQEGRNTDTPDGAAQKCISAIEAIIREARAALTPPEGHVVVTRNEAGQAVAVTRQDNGGRILSVIAEFQYHPSVPVATLAALADRWASERDYTGSPVDDIRALIDEPTTARPEVP